MTEPTLIFYVLGLRGVVPFPSAINWLIDKALAKVIVIVDPFTTNGAVMLAPPPEAVLMVTAPKRSRA